MQTIQFEALGTKWSIIIDAKSFSHDVKDLILTNAKEFENKYSRFIKDSLVNKFNGNQKIKDIEFQELYSFGKKLERISKNSFNINVGQILGNLGYGSGEQGIDFGGFGKGWLIDNIAILLKEKKYRFFLIDAGGDIFATKKKNGNSWKVALEHPKNIELAIGTVEIKNSALASSSPFKRTWGDSHHLIDMQTGKPSKDNKAVFVQAKTAKAADAMATTFSVCDKADIEEISKKLECEYLVLDKDKITKSNNFSVELF